MSQNCKISGPTVIHHKKKKRGFADTIVSGTIAIEFCAKFLSDPRRRFEGGGNLLPIES